MEHDIKDTNASLKNVMASAGAQYENERAQEGKTAKRRAMVGGVVKGFFMLVAVGLLATGYIYREDLNAVLDEYKEARTEEKAAAKAAAKLEEGPSSGDRMRQGIAAANASADKRDSILDEIHSKGMSQ